MSIIERLTSLGKQIIPRALFCALQPTYHYVLALTGALLYRFPARKLIVVGVTGTKGKSTISELITHGLRMDGAVVALTSTVHFQIGDHTERNLFKMSMPGRFFMQKFLRRAVNAGCTHAVVEMTSEGSRFFRHTFIDMDVLVVTNLTPEHIESHGSFENYREAKLAIVRKLNTSYKTTKVLVVNADDPQHEHFVTAAPDAEVREVHLGDGGAIDTNNTRTSTFTFAGQPITVRLPGTFNVMNALQAASALDALNIPDGRIRETLETFPGVRGRVEYVSLPDREFNFDVIVDYAHTVDSLKSFYSIFTDAYTIAILGNTGGGRDVWKRPEMARVAEECTDEIILTNEDPYDEDPQTILDEMANGIENKDKLTIILDRREAIAEALKRAHNKPDSVVLITGKGTDPYIMGPNGTKQEWDDATVVREELVKL